MVVSSLLVPHSPPPNCAPFPLASWCMPAKNEPLATYHCECKLVLHSVGPLAIQAHLGGKKHADRMKEEISTPFQDYSCECGQKLTHVKQYQIDQHRQGRPCIDRRSAMRQQSLMAKHVEPVHREFSFDEDQRPAEPLRVDESVGPATDIQACPWQGQASLHNARLVLLRVRVPGGVHARVA